MRIKVTIDVRLPLKTWKKISCKGGSDSIVSFKYERLPNFCFIVVYLDIQNSFVLNLQFCLKIRFRKNEVPG